MGRWTQPVLKSAYHWVYINWTLTVGNKKMKEEPGVLVFRENSPVWSSRCGFSQKRLQMQHPLLKCLGPEAFWLPDFFMWIFTHTIHSEIFGGWDPSLHTKFIDVLCSPYTHSLKVISHIMFNVPEFWLGPVTWAQMWNFALLESHQFQIFFLSVPDFECTLWLFKSGILALYIASLIIAMLTLDLY